MGPADKLDALRAAHKALEVPPSYAVVRSDHRAAGTSMQNLLRQWCRSQLDMPIQPVWESRNHPGQQAVLSCAELAQAYERRREHMLGRQMMLEWSIGHVMRSNGDNALDVPRVGVAFWHSIGGSKGVPDTFAYGLKTALRNSGLQVHVYHYSSLTNLPQGVSLHDARLVLGYKIAQDILSSKGVQFLADYVRALALLPGGLSPEGGGWFLDGDTVWLQQAPSLSVVDPSTLGHFLASQQGARVLRGKSKDEFDRHWSLNYLKTQGDQAYLASPFAFSPGSPLLLAWVNRLSVVKDLPAACPRLAYHIPLDALTALVRQMGLEPSIADIDVCSPVSRFLKEKVIQAKFAHLVELSKVRKALCVNNFWQSSKNLKLGDGAVEAGSLARVQPASPWQAIMDIADGQPYKSESSRKRKRQKG